MSETSRLGDGVSLQIRREFADVAPYIPQVQSSADANRDALGFLPFSAYGDAASRGNLYVAISRSGSTTNYAGHLLIGGVFPHAKIFQLFVRPEFRNAGIARRLVEHLVVEMEKHGFLSISAAVAADLDANVIWEHLGFKLVRKSPGGVTTGRWINYRVRQLATPDLFTSCPSTPEQVRLIERLGFRTPLYAIDLNVFWDVVKHRSRAEYANLVIRAALSNLVRVVVTREFVKELERSSKPNPVDPALAFAMQLPTLPEPESTILDSLVSKLGVIVFPEKSASKALSTQDRSDLVHLATAIHYQVTGFVTCENVLIKAGQAIHARYGVRVLHVQELAAALTDIISPTASVETRMFGDTLAVSKIAASDLPTLRRFLDEFDAPASARDDLVGGNIEEAGRRGIVVRSASDIVCAASWDIRGALSEGVSAWVIANDEHHAVETALEYVVGRICSEASASCPARVHLQMPKGHAVGARIAITHGFIPGGRQNATETQLDKVCVGAPVHSGNWTKIRAVLNRCSGLSFGENLPEFQGIEQGIAFTDANGASRVLTLYDLESFLSPVLFALTLRPGCVVPIRRSYADSLIGASPQLTMVPDSEARLFRERVYFSSPRNEKVLLKGCPLLFYESGTGRGRSCVIAVARVTRTTVFRKSEVSAGLLQHGVVGLDAIGRLTSTESIAATTFDNLLPLRRPVALARLRDIGLADGTNLVTARSITDEQLRTVLEEGNP